MPGGRTDPVRVVALLDGRASWRQLSLYCSEHAVLGALNQGRLVRSARGRYVLPDLPGVVLHHVAIPSDDLRSRTTSPLRTVLDCAAVLPFREGLAVADSALRSGLVRAEDLTLLTPGGGAAAPRIRRVTAHADGEAANPFESARRAEVLDAGLGGFVPQRPVRLRNGATVRVDLGDPLRRPSRPTASSTTAPARRFGTTAEDGRQNRTVAKLPTCRKPTRSYVRTARTL
jgi:hypothetical protein